MQYYIHFTESHTYFGVTSSLFTNKVKSSSSKAPSAIIIAGHNFLQVWCTFLPALNSMHRQLWKLHHWLCKCVESILLYLGDSPACKEISLITLHIFYDSLVHWLYKGHHIWRKVKNRNISRLQFTFMRVCVATIK